MYTPPNLPPDYYYRQFVESRGIALRNPSDGQMGYPYNEHVQDSAPSIVVGATTLAGNIGGGIYAYRAKGGFWWTLLGIIVGGSAGLHCRSSNSPSHEIGYANV